MTGRPRNESLALAKLSGDKRYIGAPHSKCGTTERYVTNGGCVHCARADLAEQRAQLKFMKAQLADEAAEQEINHGEIEPEIEVDVPDAEAYDQSVNDLM
jgi:hypothetical protein